MSSWLELRGQALRTQDSNAHPVGADPWIEQAELTASDGASGGVFGGSVAVSGNIAVVGASGKTVGSNGAQGAAYVFVESGGIWSQQAELTASDGAASAEFGGSVAVSGNMIVVGASFGASKTQGAAYVFVQNGTTWSQQAELTASDGAYQDWFGYSVGISGNTVVVGAPNHLVGSNGEQGAAYVFAQSGTKWTQQAELTESNGATGDLLGWAVSISGSTIVAGAIDHNVGSTSQGAAFVFVESAGTWTQQAELTASDGASGDWFGFSVAAGSSTVVVGAPLHMVGSTYWEGAAYVFVESGGIWSQQAELTTPGSGRLGQFGNSVSLDGGTCVVGEYAQMVGSSVGQGAAYVFAQNGSTWSQQAELLAFDGAAQEDFGTSVAIAGDTILVGDPRKVGSNGAAGSADVFGSSGPLYTLSAAPNSLSMPQGGQATSTITITPYNGFGGSVSLSGSDLPNGVTAVFNPNPATTDSTLTLSASPTATAGTQTGVLVGTSGSLAQTTTVTLTVTAAPVVSLSPASLIFKNQAVNTTSSPKAVTLSNTGTVALSISSIAITSGSNFAISSNTCGATLNAGKKCTVKVTFTPTQLVSADGTLSFTDNAYGSPQTVSLSGTAVVQAQLNPSTYTFPKTKVGATSVAHIFTLKNNMLTTLTGISYSTAGPFAVSASTCGATLNSMKECTISVTFSPTATGIATGTLTVSDSANDSPQTSSIKGTGD